MEHFQMDKKAGVSARWYENGQKKSQGSWKNGRDAKWTYGKKTAA